MTMHVTIRQLRAFVAVVETGSFSEAAKAMSLSQAALSGLVAELENRVGVRLLDRNTRSVALSAVGQAFEPMARRVLATLEDALDSLADLKELRRGIVRVAAPETLSCTLMPELIATYNSNHPDIEVRFEDVPIEAVLTGLLQGNTDVGFGPAGVIADESVEIHPLWDDPL
ncbi:MAG: LysR family transcriptional regulator, partial [Comamonadaceae bacterium]